jgi:hypothetical protein
MGHPSGQARPVRTVRAVGDLKTRQAAKIRELGEALATSGFDGLDGQAKVLGLSRSTTWTILKASHKNSGLSAAIINRMLAAPALPPRVRLRIFEYIEEKSAGLYGDDKTRLRKFTARISATRNSRTQSS